MEGVFSFFLESSFLGLFLLGEKKLGRMGHWLSAFLVFLGSWLSGYFIVATDAWMQHPTKEKTVERAQQQIPEAGEFDTSARIEPVGGCLSNGGEWRH